MQEALAAMPRPRRGARPQSVLNRWCRVCVNLDRGEKGAAGCSGVRTQDGPPCFEPVENLVGEIDALTGNPR